MSVKDDTSQIWSDSEDLAGDSRIHYGFGNYESPRALIITRNPSSKHFKVFSNPSVSGKEYCQLTEEQMRTVLGWPLYRSFINHIFGEFGYNSSRAVEHLWETPAIKQQLTHNRYWHALDSGWLDILQRELHLFASSAHAVITSGKIATQAVVHALGVPRGEAKSIDIMDEQTWGRSPFNSRLSVDIPVYHAINWAAPERRRSRADAYWESVESIREDLRADDFPARD